MRLGFGGRFPGEALINRLRCLVGDQIEKAVRAAARLLAGGQLPVGSGPGAGLAPDPLPAGPPPPDGHAPAAGSRGPGPPADWLERVRRGAPDLLVPGRIPTMRALGWRGPGRSPSAPASEFSHGTLPAAGQERPPATPPAPPPESSRVRPAAPVPERLPDPSRVAASAPLSPIDPRDSPAFAAPDNGAVGEQAAARATSPVERDGNTRGFPPGPVSPADRPAPPPAGRTDALGAAGQSPVEHRAVARESASIPSRLRAPRERPLEPPAALARPAEGAADPAAPASGQAGAPLREAQPPGATPRPAPIASTTPATPRERPASRARFAEFPPLEDLRGPADGPRTIGRARQPTRLVEEGDRFAGRWEPPWVWPSPGESFPQASWPSVAALSSGVRSGRSEDVPHQLDGGFGYPSGGPEDPWPSLPEDRPDEVEDGTALLRAWERQRRLDREQRGVGWNG